MFSGSETVVGGLEVGTVSPFVLPTAELTSVVPLKDALREERVEDSDDVLATSLP